MRNVWADVKSAERNGVTFYESFCVKCCPYEVRRIYGIFCDDLFQQNVQDNWPTRTKV